MSVKIDWDDPAWESGHSAPVAGPVQGDDLAVLLDGMEMRIARTVYETLVAVGCRVPPEDRKALRAFHQLRELRSRVEEMIEEYRRTAV